MEMNQPGFKLIISIYFINKTVAAHFKKCQIPRYEMILGGLLKYDLGRDVPLRLEKLTHFLPNFAKKWDLFLYQSHKFY